MYRRVISATAAGLGVAAMVAVAATGVLAKSAGKADSATAWVAITHAAGKNQFAAGNVKDKVLGNGAVTYVINVGTGAKPGTIKVVATVIVFTKTGSLSGNATATLTVNSDGSGTFSNGKLNLTKGSGGQRGHSFVGTFTGSAKTAVTGPFVFHEKGTYK